MRRVGAVVAMVLVAGCAAPPAPVRPDRATVCATQLTYWAGEDLRGADSGFDYQEMGLTSEQNDALTTIVEAARTRGVTAVDAGVADMARDACLRLAAQPSSGF